MGPGVAEELRGEERIGLVHPGGDFQTWRDWAATGEVYFYISTEGRKKR